jgi:biopolymer transport protein ExbB
MQRGWSQPRHNYAKRCKQNKQNNTTNKNTDVVMARCTARLAINAFAIVALIGVPALALAQGTPEALPTVPAIGSSDLPRDLSPWGMFLSADPLVKGVLLGLAFASVVTWTVWLAKTIELLTASARARRACAKLASARHLAEAVQALAKAGGAGREFIDAAVTELRLSEDGMEREGVKERLASRLQRIEANRGRIMMRGTGVLATIGATAPFVGLFGTVWGIMNSFIGISKSQTTNLAVVAPGIAEALLATAIGLVAAIPAVVIYNVFSRQIASYRALLADASAEVLRLVGRDLDRAAAPQPAGRRSMTLSAAE